MIPLGLHEFQGAELSNSGGQESIAFGDAGYQGIEKRPDAKNDVNWQIAMGPGKRKALDKENGKHAANPS